MSLRDLLRGTGVALVTPFKSNEQIDFDALDRLLSFVMHGGVEYLVVLGTTGEAPTLERSEKVEVINFISEKIGTLLPIVIGVGGNNTKELSNDLETLPLQSATAVLSTSPYYNRPSQEGIFQHYTRLAQASPKPIILYNVPSRTGSNISAETTLRLSENDNIQGIKEASGNMVQCLHVLRHRPTDFLVTSGDDHLTLPLIAAGMDGVISVAANCFPKDFSEMVRLCLANDFETAKSLLYKLLEGFDLLFEENNPGGIKSFLTELGVIENNFRLPLVPVSANLTQQIKAYLQKLNA